MAELKLVKIGGNVIENREALADFLADFAALSGPKILVHGGGQEAMLGRRERGQGGAPDSDERSPRYDQQE